MLPAGLRPGIGVVDEVAVGDDGADDITTCCTLIDTAPSTGGHEGLYARRQGSNFLASVAEADFDSFSIVVPEPAKALLVAGGLVGLVGLGVRRRRSG